MRAMYKLIILAVICGAIALGIAMNARNIAEAKNGEAAKGANGLSASEPTTATAETRAPRSKPRVKVAVLKTEPITEYLVLPASVEAWQDIDLSLKIGGTVEWVGPKEGDTVTSGQVILRLDRAALDAQLAQVKAQVDQAERTYDRMENLLKSRVIQKAELDKYTEARDMARAGLRMVQVAIDNTVLRAPANGVIDRLPVDRGEHVDMGKVVAKIVQIDRLKVVVNLPEKDVSFFKEGMTAELVPIEVSTLPVSVPAGIQEALDKQKTVQGKIYFVALTADPMNRTYPMHIEIDNAKRELRPGMIVRVRLVRRHVEEAVTVPMYAAVPRGDKQVVFVEKGGKAEERTVIPGIINHSKVQAVYGVQAGERLIVVGQRDLVNGADVIVDAEVDADSQEVQSPLEAMLPAGLKEAVQP